MQWFGLEHTLQVFFSPKALPAPCLKQGWGTAWALCSCPGAGAVVGGSGDTAQGQDGVLEPQNPGTGLDYLW